jgi:polysaccharide biosynthesis protein PslG
MSVLRALTIAALAAALTCAAPAAARAPAGFFGVYWDDGLGAADTAQEAQWATMASSGVETVRASFSWADAQPRQGQPFDLSRSDRIVRLAATHGLTLLPVVQYAPDWARAYRNRPTSPPRHEADYTAYLTALVTRYGPAGSFWAENPGLPRAPLREWQIWNEPHLLTYWDAPPRSHWGAPRGYVRLLRASHRAIKAVDPGATVVLAGLTQLAWNELTKLYRAGARSSFEVATIQTFPQTAARALRATRLFRRAMIRAGDGGKRMYITEITWPASKGRTKGIRFQRQETDRGMARRLTEALPLLANNARRLHLARVYWYTWASEYGHGGSIFRYAGLQRYAHGVFSPRPALHAFQRTVRRLER